MSYKRRTEVALSDGVSAERISYRCPANGCLNAASVSFGGQFACFHHANASPSNWSAVTRWVGDNAPESLNWGVHKARHEAAKSKLRAANVVKKGPTMREMMELPEA